MAGEPDYQTLFGRYGSDMVRRVYKSWYGEGKTAPGKQQQVAALVAMAKTGGPTPLLPSALSPTQQSVLWQAQQQDNPTLSSVTSATLAMGFGDASAGTLEMVERGLLLVWPEMASTMFELAHVHAHPGRRVVTAPFVGQIKAPQLPEPKLTRVSPEKVVAVTSSSPAGLIAGVLRLANLLAKKPIRLTRDGRLPANQFPMLEKNLGLTTRELPTMLVVEVARASGITTSGEGYLSAAPDALTRLTRPVGEVLSSLFSTFIHHDGWQDDVPGDTSGEIWEALCQAGDYRGFPPYRSPVGISRAFLATVLSRIFTREWVDLDSFTDAALSLNPRLLFVEAGPYHSSYKDDEQTPYGQAIQQAYVRSFITRTCLTFGLVDLGQLGDTLPYFTCPANNYRHWQQFRNMKDLIRFRREAERDKPVWQREPAGVSFRLTPFGREVLQGEARTLPTHQGPLINVGPDFEILGPRDHLPPDLRMRLEVATQPLPGHNTDPVLRYRLERGRLVELLKSGVALTTFVTELETAAGRHLPANVARTLEDWAKSYGSTRIYHQHDLLEFRDQATRDTYLQHHPGPTPVGDRFALATPETRVGTLIDYSTAPTRCLTWTADDEVELDPSKRDLLIETELAKFTVAGSRPGRYRLTRNSVRQSKLKPDEILVMLLRRSLKQYSPRLEICVMGWCGEVKPLPMDTVTVLEVNNSRLLPLLMAMPEIQTLVRGQLPPNLLVVKSGGQEKLRKVLQEWGVELSEGLTLRELDA